ncbi:MULTISPECIES: prephenate dehydrogenase [unclassified Virgibacillus]|uniref:prephenate dehydrogenase n=1 Tax=unclassified Virgibacillus TaxID=2620237 RepID=UPI0024DEB7F3|nr:prephenate dehydrogenase [Virgibacillus sp. LDC-1]
MKTKVLIVGLGLIGGSIAKNLAQSDVNHVIGFDVHKASLTYAKEHNIINEITEDLLNACRYVDFIILATPITETIAYLKKFNEVPFHKDVVIMDVSSVKGKIMKTAAELHNEHITFIGGHPMAGSHKRGVQAAKAHLFENAIFVLTPLPNTRQAPLSNLKLLLQSLKSKFVIMQPNEHDEMTGVVSHFPHLIASSLVHQAKKWEQTHTYLPKLAAGGFRDITRIASSNPALWQDIFSHNREKMSVLLEDWIMEMKALKNLLDYNKTDQIISYLEVAKNYRDGLGYKEKGAVPSFYDLYVDIRDQPGALANVVQLLAAHAISIANIQILEIREGLTGALCISFASENGFTQSAKILQQSGFEVTIAN